MSKSIRRAKGEGSISRRRDGRRQFAIDVEPDGEKRRRSYLYAWTRSELQRKIVDERARNGGEIKPRARGTAAEWIDRWIEQDVKPNPSAKYARAVQRGVGEARAGELGSNGSTCAMWSGCTRSCASRA